MAGGQSQHIIVSKRSALTVLHRAVPARYAAPKPEAVCPTSTSHADLPGMPVVILCSHPPPLCRSEILKQYARHLGDAEVLAVAHATPGMAGRDLKDICEQAERRWASKVGGARRSISRQLR